MAEEIDQPFPVDKSNVEAAVRAGITNSCSAQSNYMSFCLKLTVKFLRSCLYSGNIIQLKEKTQKFCQMKELQHF